MSSRSSSSSKSCKKSRAPKLCITPSADGADRALKIFTQTASSHCFAQMAKVVLGVNVETFLTLSAQIFADPQAMALLSASTLAVLQTKGASLCAIWSRSPVEQYYQINNNPEALAQLLAYTCPCACVGPCTCVVSNSFSLALLWNLALSDLAFLEYISRVYPEFIPLYTILAKSWQFSCTVIGLNDYFIANPNGDCVVIPPAW